MTPADILMVVCTIMLLLAGLQAGAEHLKEELEARLAKLEARVAALEAWKDGLDAGCRDIIAEWLAGEVPSQRTGMGK